jgi:hypothetical protein
MRASRGLPSSDLLARALAPLAAAGLAFALWWSAAPTVSPDVAIPAATPEALPTPTTLVVALQPLPTQARAPTAMPTRVPVPSPTPETFKPLLPEHRILAYYGNPLAREMGILGEIPPDQMLSRLAQQIKAYAALDKSRPVVPALELVTPAAQGWPGDEGLYRARMKPEVIDQVAGWASEQHALLILDVQIGLSTVPQEVDALMPYLRRQNVHLALDPEFAIPSGHAPGEVVGSIDGATIDGVIHTLSQLVASEHLPPKILIIHRFTDAMVTNTWEIAPDPNVQVVVTMDGFGPPALKLAQYRMYVHDQRVEFSGVKLFYHHDVPLLSPNDVLGLDPEPDLVIYQ